MDKEQLLAVAKELGLKHGKALALDVCEQLLLPALDEVVKNSENKIDDVLWLAVKDEALKKVKELVA